MKRCELSKVDDLQPRELQIHAVEGGIYVASAQLSGETVPLYHCGRRLVSRNLTALRQTLSLSRCRRVSLIQLSAYDEMLGQPCTQASNTLQLPLAPLTLDELPG